MRFPATKVRLPGRGEGGRVVVVVGGESERGKEGKGGGVTIV